MVITGDEVHYHWMVQEKLHAKSTQFRKQIPIKEHYACLTVQAPSYGNIQYTEQ